MRALCLGILLARVATSALAATQCTENPDWPLDLPDGSPGFCKTCSADNSGCQECWPGWSADEAGKCVQCADTWCLACDPADPSFCLECGDWSGESEYNVGYYALDNGTCATCPTDNCLQCENGNGTCTGCITGMGVVDGVCTPCTDQDACASCAGSASRCTACLPGFWLHKESGRCRNCPENCYSCSDSETCLQGGCGPEGLTLDPAGSGKCIPCTSQGCTQCSKGPNACDSCDTGYTMMPDQTCRKCTAKHCTTCAPGKPDVCTVCAGSSSDPWHGGPSEDRSACMPCAAKHCAACQSDFRACDWCEDGYYNDPDQGDCLPCAASLGAACSWCGLDTTAGDPGVPTCFGCVEGYEFDDASSKCVSAPS